MFSLVDSPSESDFHLLFEVIASLTLCMSSSPLPHSLYVFFSSPSLSVCLLLSLPHSLYVFFSSPSLSVCLLLLSLTLCMSSPLPPSLSVCVLLLSLTLCMSSSPLPHSLYVFFSSHSLYVFFSSPSLLRLCFQSQAVRHTAVITYQYILQNLQQKCWPSWTSIQALNSTMYFPLIRKSLIMI